MELKAALETAGCWGEATREVNLKQSLKRLVPMWLGESLLARLSLAQSLLGCHLGCVLRVELTLQIFSSL